MNPLTAVAVRTGLVPPEALKEFARYRTPLDLEALPTPPKQPYTLDEITSLLDEALQSEGLVAVRETDLNILHEYLATALSGVLHVAVVLGEEERATDVDVRYGKTPLGEYIIAWQAESIWEMLCNGHTYLREADQRVYFQDARELFFGEQKAFLVCTSGHVEKEASVGDVR